MSGITSGLTALHDNRQNWKTKFLSELIETLHKWEFAESIFVYQIWKSSCGDYYCRHYSENDKHRHIYAVHQDHRPVNHLIPDITDIANKYNAVLLDFYKPQNIPDRYSIRAYRYDTGYFALSINQE
ncbi:hypothetical protein F1737_08930 [Methanoplanus sp. FWC-SCC4]|uniref:Uncharacterized protein n=1 Tax=Methanochimaera problematica TaxID=2609417 RepID=A0AA97FEI0_9EURY|nr:hypothetical protein [Methanoplanus sp. FWC-SCC4]WOF16803.1 hypothetical protein F1737_08930 [Methanoplanus sp. FWC-SCC4]